MGTWGIGPWENDLSSDWFGRLFKKTKLEKYVEKALSLDVDEYFEEIRAAAAILLALGYNHVWPTEKLESHLELAISKLDEILKNSQLPVHEDEAIVVAIAKELSELHERLASLKM